MGLGEHRFEKQGQGLLGAVARADVGPLRQRFFMAPMSVLNTREGDWQNRRRQWLSLGIQSEAGRDDALTFRIPIELSDGSKGNKIRNQTSIFDPVLAELCYNWWCAPGGVVIDPFAGGSVRGIVASVAGYKYWGCELRGEQVAANREQLNELTTGKYKPRWVEGDSLVEVPAYAPVADFIFSCPPYGNLERYSENPKDISTLPYDRFLAVYSEIIRGCVIKLRDNRFSAWVVANYRDKDTGEMRDFVGDTIRAFERAGMRYYNDGILVNSVGSGAMRANNTFIRGGRKLVKSHQNVLVFVKGCHKAAAEYIPEIFPD